MDPSYADPNWIVSWITFVGFITWLAQILAAGYIVKTKGYGIDQRIGTALMSIFCGPVGLLHALCLKDISLEDRLSSLEDTVRAHHRWWAKKYQED